MKIIISLILIISISPVYAEIYKCIENGSISYQQTQCKQTGTKFTPQKDISIEQQEEAVKKLTADLEAIAEQKKLQKEADDKERLIRSEEDKARASRALAEATTRQTDAIKNRNNPPNNQPSYSPYYPIVRPLPDHPEAKPLPARPRAQPLPEHSRTQPSL